MVVRTVCSGENACAHENDAGEYGRLTHLQKTFLTAALGPVPALKHLVHGVLHEPRYDSGL